MSACNAINNGYFRSPEFMGILRELYWQSVRFDFRVTAVHIKGEQNIVPDMISRLHEEKSMYSFVKLLILNNVSLDFSNHMSINAFMSVQETVS